jgi:hypothetical protein
VTEAKVIVGLVILIAVLGLVGWGLKASYDSGETSGKAQVQTAWDTDKAKIQAVTDAAIAKATKDKETAIATNEGVINELQAQLSTASASANTYASQLRDTRTRLAASLSALSQARNNPVTSAAPAAPGVGQLDAATGAALSECYAVRASYSALIKELSPQLAP